MRLISQDGKIDIPYTSTSIEITSEDGGGHTLVAHAGKNRFIMGNYYLLANAMNALAGVSKAHMRGWKMFQFPQED
jgi:hypothetical protein